jgi:hypothetical protein
MRKGFFGSLTTIVAGAGLALAQSATPPSPTLLEPPTLSSAPEAASDSSVNSSEADEPKDKEPPVAKPEAEEKEPAAKPEAEEKEPAAKPEADEKESPAKPKPLPEAIPAPKQPAVAPPLRPALAPGGDCCPNIIPCNECKPCSRYWGSAEYLLWWIEDGPIRGPLITTGPAASFGFLGAPGVTTVGPHNLDYGTLSGGRVTLGYWLSDDQEIGMEVSGFYVGDGHQRATISGGAAGSPVLARPVVNVLTGLATTEFISFPGAFAGNFQIASNSHLWGADVNARGRAFDGDNGFLDFLFGFRYLDLEEDLNLTQGSQILGGGVVGLNGPRFGPPNTISIRDGFDTRNQFYGGQLGARTEVRFGQFSVDLIIKVALGVCHEADTIAGSTTIISPSGATTTAAGGLLAISSNSGHHKHDEFAVLPEATLNVGYQFTDAIRVFAGYNFLYLDEVARPGDQINRTVNPSRVPSSLLSGPVPFGPAVPTGSIRSSDIWVQGVNFGVAFRY